MTIFSQFYCRLWCINTLEIKFSLNLFNINNLDGYNFYYYSGNKTLKSLFTCYLFSPVEILKKKRLS